MGSTLYGLLLTFGLALIIEGVFRQQYGSSGQPYAIPPELQEAEISASCFCRNYRAWVIVASARSVLGTWYHDRAHSARRLSACVRREPGPRSGLWHQRAADDHLDLWRRRRPGGAAGVMQRPIYQVSPLMGSNIIHHRISLSW